MMHGTAHPAFSAGWAGLGLLGAALPLRRRRSWAESTRNSHLMMCLVMTAMVVPGAPWWFPVGSLALLAATSARTLAGDDPSPDVLPCLIDAVAMGLLVLVGLVVGHGTSGMDGHSSAGFTLLSLQMAAMWVVAACWSRRPGTVTSPRVRRVPTGKSLRAITLPMGGTTLMAVAMVAMTSL